jgi:hypothetical protein
MLRAMCASRRVYVISGSVQIPVADGCVSISLVWLCLQESLRAWLIDDGPHMSFHLGSTT